MQTHAHLWQAHQLESKKEMKYCLRRSRVWVCNGTKPVCYPPLSCIGWKSSSHHRAPTWDHKLYNVSTLAWNLPKLPAEKLGTICLSQCSRTSPISWVVFKRDLRIKATLRTRVCLYTFEPDCASARMYEKNSNNPLKLQCTLVWKDGKLLSLEPGCAGLWWL